MLVEEFSPVFHYIKDSKNVIADALSRLPFEKEKGSVASLTLPSILKSLPANSPLPPSSSYDYYTAFDDLKASEQ